MYLLDVGEHLLARFPLGRVARLRHPQLLALLHALDLAPQRPDFALDLAPDPGLGFEAAVLGAQRLARLFRGAEVPGDGLFDVLDPVAPPVPRDRVEAHGIDAEDRFGQTVGLRPVGDEVVEEEFPARLVNAGPPCGRRRRSKCHQVVLSAPGPRILDCRRRIPQKSVRRRPVVGKPWHRM